MAKHTAVINGDFMYMYGGYGYHDDYVFLAYNELYRLDLKEWSWTRVDTINSPAIGRYDHESVVHDDEMYVYGGKSLSDAAFPDSYCYGTTESQGRKRARYTSELDDGINHVCLHNDLWALNLTTMTWRLVHEGPSFDDGSLSRKRFTMVKYTPPKPQGREVDSGYLRKALWAETVHMPRQVLMYYQRYLKKMSRIMDRSDNGIPQLRPYYEYVTKMMEKLERFSPDYHPPGEYAHYTVPVLVLLGSLLVTAWLHMNIQYRKQVARKACLWPMCLWAADVSGRS
eukprot:6451036-Pyramimonas_sp.AAC.1